MDRRRGTRAFTLVEILVVCVILGILLVMMLTNLMHALRKAYEGRSFAGLQTLRTAVQTWKAVDGPSYSYDPVGIENATNGNPWAIVQDNPVGAVTPPVADGSWTNGNVGYDAGLATTGVTEKGQYAVYMNRYIDVFPTSQIANEKASFGLWDTSDGTPKTFSSLTNGAWQTNRLTSDVWSSPNGGVSGSARRGWHYRNTDGTVRINNTCTSTENKRYDYY